MAGDRELACPKHWDLSPGKKFQADVFARFRSSVHHPSSSTKGCFFLLAVFRRFTFRLTEESVSLALHSILGGAPAGFHVRFESDRHFRFSVASKDVGFLVCSLKRVITESFDVYFHLWRDGGADWQREKILWEKEEDKQWTRVTRKNKASSKKLSFANPINQLSPAKKFVPPTQTSSIKIGSFICPIRQDFDLAGSSISASGHSLVHSSKAFARLKNSLFSHYEDGKRQGLFYSEASFSRKKSGVNKASTQPNTAAHDTVSNEAKNRDQTLSRTKAFTASPEEIDTDWQRLNAKDQHVPHQHSFSPKKSTSSKACFKCLSLGHFVRDCRNKIRCRFCFSYGHVERMCFKKRAQQHVKWQPKKTDNVDMPQERTRGPSNTKSYCSGKNPMPERTSIHNTSSLDPSTSTSTHSEPVGDGIPSSGNPHPFFEPAHPDEPENPQHAQQEQSASVDSTTIAGPSSTPTNQYPQQGLAPEMQFDLAIHERCDAFEYPIIYHKNSAAACSAFHSRETNTQVQYILRSLLKLYSL